MTVTTDPTGDAPATAPHPPGGQSTDPGTGPSRSRRSGARLALVVACGFLLVLEGVVGVGLVRARSENADLRRQLDAQVATLDDTLTQLDATRRHVDALRTDTSQRDGNLQTSAQIGIVRNLEITELSAQLGRLSTKADDLRSSIAGNHAIDQTQVQQLLVLNQCLDGIKLADVAAAKGDTPGTIAALTAVTDVCQKALTAVNPGDNANFPFDFADPSVIYGNDGKYYAYATNAAAGNVQVLWSKDLVKWNLQGGTLASLPGWAKVGDTWAPSVLHRDEGYFMYYTARTSGGIQCISVATSDRPDGGFVDRSAGPLVCQGDQFGSIDPSAFVASDGSAYLLWKSEGETRGGGGAKLWSRKLADDFTSFDGDAHVIEGVSRPWEGRTVEGPSMAEANGKFYLFYSGNSWGGSDYAEGYSICEQPIGPCRKPADNILLQSHDAIQGPGGGEVFMAPGGQLFMSYHAWTQGYVGYPNRRQLHVDKLSFPSSGPEVVPVS